MEHTIVDYKGQLLAKKVTQCDYTEVQLKGQDLIKLDGSRRGVQINVVDGTIWVTQAGDAEDHMVRTGQSFKVTHPGLVLAQGAPLGKIHIVAS